MPQPKRYERTHDFTHRDPDRTDHAAINEELDDVSISINQTREKLAMFQRDDGGLKRGIVGSEQLSEEAFARMIDAATIEAKAESEAAAKAAATSASRAINSANITDGLAAEVAANTNTVRGLTADVLANADELNAVAANIPQLQTVADNVAPMGNVSANLAEIMAAHIYISNLANGDGAANVGYDGGTVRDVLDGAKSFSDYDALRAYSGRALSGRIIAPGIAGTFQLDAADATTADNGGTVIVDGAGRRWKRQFSGPAYGEWFGIVGDSVADDTDALERAIEYSAPYQWQGTVQATNAAQQVRNELYLGKLVCRITRPLKLSKGCAISGQSPAGFFQTANTATILADFDDMDAWILDTAPYKSDGVRHSNAQYSGGNFDNRGVSAVNSILIDKINITVAPGRRVLGGINLTASSQSHITRTGITATNVGVRTSASWAGTFRDNHIYTKAIGVFCSLDTTVWDIESNYITVTNNPDAGYVWPAGAGSSAAYEQGTAIFGEYACILLKFANPIMKNNILEGGNIGIAAESGLAFNAYANYMEAIKKYCYALNTTNANIVGGYTACPSARLLWANGAPDNCIGLDFRGAAKLDVQRDAFTVRYIDRVTVRAKNAINFKYNSRVDLITQLHETGKNQIFLSSSGDDTNNGLHKTQPVATLQEAALRVRPGMANEIIVQAGDTVGTKHVLADTDSASYAIPDTSIVIKSTGAGDTRGKINVGQSGGLAHALQMASGRLTFENVIVNLPSAADSSYRAFIRSYGNLSVSAQNSKFSGAGETSALFGSRWGFSATFAINTNNCQFENLKFVHQATSVATVAWTENNSGSSFTNVTTDSSMKIFSKQFT